MTEYSERASLNGTSERKEAEADDQDRKHPREKPIDRGDLFFLWHPTTPDTFSGYGLTLLSGRNDLLVGVLMVDRPQPVDPGWLKEVEDTFGECRLAPMTANGERGITCQMRIGSESLPYVHQLPTEKATAIQQALHPLLEGLPKPCLGLRWDELQGLWVSEIIRPFELSWELREVFERTGPGCVPAETNLGVVHVCHASDRDIESFVDKPVTYQWQLTLMPTAPILRLGLRILDQPDNPYKFESFLNVGREDDTRVLELLQDQETLYMTFYGEDLSHHFTKVLDHEATQREQLRRLADQAKNYLRELPETQHDFDQAKREFQRCYPL